MSKFQRKSLFNTNKYQFKILLLIFIPMFVISVGNFFTLNMFFDEVINLVISGISPQSIDYLYALGYAYLAVLWAFFFILFLVVIKMSSRMVGPYDRIIREMDSVINSGTQKPIKLRRNDEFLSDIVERINRLISGYQSKTPPQ